MQKRRNESPGMKVAASARARPEQQWFGCCSLLSIWKGKQEAAPPCGAVKPRVDVKCVSHLQDVLFVPAR